MVTASAGSNFWCSRFAYFGCDSAEVTSAAGSSVLAVGAGTAVGPVEFFGRQKRLGLYIVNTSVIKLTSNIIMEFMVFVDITTTPDSLVTPSVSNSP